MPIGLKDQGVFVISPSCLVAVLCLLLSVTSPLHPLTHLYFFVHLLNFVYFLCRVSPHLLFGLYVFVFDHFNFSFRAVAEVTPSSLLFDYVQFLSPLFFMCLPMCLI